MKPAGRWVARGQTLVEFALVIPIFLLVMLGIAEGGYYVVVTTAASNATHEAARLGVLGKTSDIAAIKARLEQAAAPVLTIADSQITVKLNGAACDDACYDGRNLGDRLTVSADYEHRPLVGYVFSQASFDVTSTAEMMVEGPNTSGSTPPSPTATPTAAPTATPTPDPAATPTPTPTAAPTATPTPAPSTLLALESFEGTFPPSGWTLFEATAGTGFTQTNVKAHTGTYSASKHGYSGKPLGILTSPVIDTSGYTSITVGFWWYLFGIDGGHGAELQFLRSDGVWVFIRDVNNKTLSDNVYAEDVWLDSTAYSWSTITDPLFMHPNFQIRWYGATMDDAGGGRYIYIDDVQVTGS